MPNSFFLQLDLQKQELPGGFSPIVNPGYAGLNRRAGLGLGALADLSERWQRLAEYYPAGILGEGSGDPIGARACFAFGLKFKTYGHQFMFLLGNSCQLGTGNLMSGTDSNDLHLGFNIYRLLTF